MPKVLISDELSPRAASIFMERGVDVDVKPGLSLDELLNIIGGYDGLAIRSATKVTQDVLDAAANLKVVGRAGIGIDNVDIGAATKRGVIVMNTPHGNSVTTAEFCQKVFERTMSQYENQVYRGNTPLKEYPRRLDFQGSSEICAVRQCQVKLTLLLPLIP